VERNPNALGDVLVRYTNRSVHPSAAARSVLAGRWRLSYENRQLHRRRPRVKFHLAEFLACFFVRITQGRYRFTPDMKKALILSMLTSFTIIICSCQKQDSAAEQQLAQRKAEREAREQALDERMNALDERVNALAERVKALAERERATANAQVVPPDAQSQDVIRDAEQLKALMSNPSLLNSAKTEKERMTQERLAQRQSTQQESRSQKQYKSQQAQKAWMSGATLPPAAEATSPGRSPAAEATSPTPSPAVEDLSPTESPASQ
jgi:myosin heavy subunit